ncbi:MAG: transposase, partial [Thermodesulfobacteriota bacterium]|nr:transposase [Thermodesulfobacteriota bacterium]
MYVDSCTTKRGDKSYTRHLLRESYRENGKVKHRTVANLSHCPDNEIAALKLALSHKGELEKLGTVDDIKTSQGMRVGAVFVLNTIAERIGLSKALSRNRQGKLALWQVLARIIDQESRLSSVRFADRHCVPDILGLDSFTENDLYRNLAWLTDNQQKIERQLFRSRYDKKSLPDLFLYDVTSSYLEGIKNELADYGYNRDGKKQIVIGLLCDPDGDPLAVRVFEGKTKDIATIPEQIRTLSKEFSAARVTMVGDKGMMKGPQIAEFNYITSLSKPEIRTLLSEGIIQMGLFDKTVTEVKDEAKGIRYVLRKNPLRQADMKESRRERVDKIFKLAMDRTEYLSVSYCRKSEVALRLVNERIERYKLKGFLSARLDGRAICVSLDSVALEDSERLDGCYVIKTNLPEASIDKSKVHDCYNDLAKVE